MKYDYLVHSNYNPQGFGGIERVVNQVIGIINISKLKAVCICGSGCVSGKEKIGTTEILNIPIIAKVFGAPVLKWGNLNLLRYGFRSTAIIFQEPYPSLWPAIAFLSWIVKKRVIVVVHADPENGIFISRAYKFIRRFVFYKSEIILTSPFVGRDLIGVSGRSHTVIPLCIDEPEMPSNVVLGIKKPYCLYIGRLASYKGIDVLASAIKRCPNIKFVIAGDGPQQEIIKQLIADQAVKNVHFIGRTISEGEKSWLIQNSRFVVFPSTSRNEAFGLVQLEAMHAGKALVNTLLGTGVNFVAPDKICAITVRPRDVSDLAMGIKKLWCNKPMADRLGRGGRERYRLCFSRKQFIDSWKKVLC